jgi:hypothetical protein
MQWYDIVHHNRHAQNLAFNASALNVGIPQIKHIPKCMSSPEMFLSDNWEPLLVDDSRGYTTQIHSIYWRRS